MRQSKVNKALEAPGHQSKLDLSTLYIHSNTNFTKERTMKSPLKGIVLIFTLIATLLLAACGGLNSKQEHKVENFEFGLVEEISDGNDSSTIVNEPLATLELENGTILEFIDVGDGYVGVVESADVNTPSVSHLMTSELNATPLELYLAFAPEDSTVPELLVQSHNLQVSALNKKNTEPRNLKGNIEVLDLDDPGYENYDCSSSYVSGWVPEWNSAFSGVTDYHPALYMYEVSQPNWAYFYPGSSYNFKTYLGVCSRKRFYTGGYWLDMIDFRVQRKGSSWYTIYSRDIYGGKKYTFFSWHPSARYRGAVRGNGGDAYPRSFGIGAAYTKSLPVAIGF